MRFRSRLFGVFALLALGWLCYGLYASSAAFQQVTTAPLPTSEVLSEETRQAATTVGAGLGAGLGITFFLCTGGFPLLLFGLLSWRNSEGLATERRHQEQLNALRPPAP